MSGKARQANRTKNNVRPSSSGRSAEVICNSVNPDLVKMGPGTVLPAVFPTFAGPALDPPPTHEFLFCFKKFPKKDPITKIKALNELKTLVANSEQDIVVNALASWAHYYPSLTVDMDRKVREATQACHGAIVRKCGRRLAPHVKRLLPAWLIAQHDEFAPAQLLAETDLNTTFPNDKLTDAIMFCKAEICNLYLDNLKGNAEYMLSGKNIVEDEKEAQVARVKASTLHALGLLIDRLPEEQDPWLGDALLPLLCANSYWQLAGHSSSAVRSAWYALTGGLLERLAERLPAELCRRCARTLVAHPENDPIVCAERWLAVLQLMRNVPDWLTLMDKKDLLVKRLLDVLENAAWGEARKLSALLLPLLSQLPAEMLTKDFYCRYFTAMFTGLSNKRLLNMKSEREHWNTIIAKCVRHVSTQHRSDEFAVSLVSWAHRTWLDSVLTGPASPTKPHLVAGTARHMAALVTFWLHRANGDGNPVFDQMVRNFWLNIGSTLSSQVEKLSTDPEDAVGLCDTHTLFIKTMQMRFTDDMLKKRSVKFIDDRTERKVPTAGAKEVDNVTYKRFKHNLSDAAETVVGCYLELMGQQRSVQRVLPSLLPLVQLFRSAELFGALARRLAAEHPLALYERVLRAWLDDEALRCRALVELVFLMVDFMSEEEKDAVFDSFGNMSCVVLEWCLWASMSHEHRHKAAVMRWVRRAPLGEALRAMVRREDDASATTLLRALNSDRAGATVSDEAIATIVETCSDMLNTMIAVDAEISLPENAAAGRAARDAAGGAAGGKARAKRRDAPDQFELLEPRVLFGADVVQAVPHDRATIAVPLLLSLFRLTLRVPRGSAQLEARTWDRVQCAWLEAAHWLPPERRTAFVRDALRYIHWHLLHDLETLNINRIDHMVSLCPGLVVVCDPAAPADHSALSVHSELVLDVQSPGAPAPPPLEVFALQLDVVWGQLSCPFEDDNEWIAAVARGEPALCRETAMLHMYRLLFRALYLKVMLVLQPSDGSRLLQKLVGEALLHVEYFQKQLCNMFHDGAVLSVLCEHYAFWSHYNIISETKHRMDNILEEIVRHLPGDVREQLAGALRESAQTHGYYWVRAHQYYQWTVEEVERQRTEELQRGPTAETPDDEDKEIKEVSTADSTNDTLTIETLNTSDLEDSEMKDDDSDHTDNEETGSTLSFEIINADEAVIEEDADETSIEQNAGEVTIEKDANYVANELEAYEVSLADDYVPCECRKGHPTNAPLIGDLEAIGGFKALKKTSYLSKAAKPSPKLASDCADIVSYIDLLGDMLLDNGFFHEAQMKGKDVINRRREVKTMFDNLQDEKLTKFEINGQCKIFDKWNDDPASYRAVGASVCSTDLYKAKEYAMMRAYYCVYASGPRCVDEFIADTGRNSNLDAVILGYYRHKDTMLFERDLARASWLQLSGTAAVADQLAEAVTLRGWDASEAHWDFTNIALCSALTSLALSAHMYRGDTTKLALVARPTLELFVRVRRFVAGVRAQCLLYVPSPHVASLPREWANLFAPDATKSLCLLICHVLDCSSQTLTASQVAILHGLTEASKLLEAIPIAKAMQAGQLSLARMVHAATHALASICHHGYKYLAYYTLRSLAPALVQADVATIEARGAAAVARALAGADGAGEGEVKPSYPKLTLALYDEHLKQLQELVDAALLNYNVCTDICELVPMTDSYSVVLGYMLLVVALHHQCELATGDLALHYVNVFQTHPYVEGILSVALRLLPASVVHFMTAALPTLPQRFKPWFIRMQDFDVNEACSSAAVSRLACAVLLRALGGPGAAAARGWRGGGAREAAALLRLTGAAVSPVLVNHQLAELQQRIGRLGKRVKVSVCLSTRTVTCSLRTEERALRVRIKLSNAHPLRAPRVLSAPPGPDPHLISVYLGYQNGRLIEALRMWVEMVGAALQVAAPCPVCYCRMHPQDGTAPAVNCRQCRNVFHTQCIRRWFTTCHRSNCPVCRTNF